MLAQRAFSPFWCCGGDPARQLTPASVLQVNEMMGVDHAIGFNPEFYTCSLSSKTIVYKGQLTPAQVEEYFLVSPRRLS